MSLKHALLAQLARNPGDRLRPREGVRRLAELRVVGESQPDLPELSRLLEAGLIRQTESGPRGRKVYETTPSGLAELRRWLRKTEPVRFGRNEWLLRIFLLWLLEHEEAEAYLRREGLLELELEELEATRRGRRPSDAGREGGRARSSTAGGSVRASAGWTGR